MLSILIPVFNYRVSNLIFEIHKLAILENIAFEIIYLEDGSKLYIEENNAELKSLKNCRRVISNSNIGRTASRDKLAHEAIYDWLLFLDADVFPRKKSFIKDYVDSMNSKKAEVVYGGFAYEKTKPNPQYILRWKYGCTYEQVDSKTRNLKPYRIVISANFLIKKAVFQRINSRIKRKSYGLDNFFGAILKTENIKVRHINNEVIHYGLDSNISYLNKIREAVSELLWLYYNEPSFVHDNSLLKTFTTLKKYKLTFLLSLFYKAFNSIIEKNLKGTKPKMLLLQVYKVSYMCNKDLT